MLASTWPHSIGANLWPQECEKLRIFRYNPWQVWNTELSCMWKISALIVSVVFSLCPPSPPLGRAGSTGWEPHSCYWYSRRECGNTGNTVNSVWQRNCEVWGIWWAGKRIYGEGLGPTVCVIKDCSAPFDITIRVGSPPNLPFSHKLLDPTVLLGTTSQFPLVSA